MSKRRRLLVSIMQAILLMIAIASVLALLSVRAEAREKSNLTRFGLLEKSLVECPVTNLSVKARVLRERLGSSDPKIHSSPALQAELDSLLAVCTMQRDLAKLLGTCPEAQQYADEYGLHIGLLYTVPGTPAWSRLTDRIRAVEKDCHDEVKERKLRR